MENWRLTESKHVNVFRPANPKGKHIKIKLGPVG